MHFRSTNACRRCGHVPSRQRDGHRLRSGITGQVFATAGSVNNETKDVPAVLPMVERVCAFHEGLDPAKYGFKAAE